MRYFSFFSVLGLLFISLFIHGQNPKNKPVKASTQPKKAQQPKITSYENTWKIIDSLEKADLPKSALVYTEALYNNAKTEKNAPQQVKAAIFILKFRSAVEEENTQKNINWLQTEANGAYSPAKQLMYSILAEHYQSYYNGNSWEILQRGFTNETAPDSVSHWNARHFEQKIKALYLQSLEPAEKLQNEKIGNFNLILTGENTEDDLQPTLYDLLVRRAITYFGSGQGQRTQASVPEAITDTTLLLPLKAFLKDAIYGNADDNRLLAFELYRKLLNYHLQKNNLNALVHADVDRLKLAQQLLTTEGKDEKYYGSLQEIEQQFKNNEASAIATYQRAQFIYDGFQPKNIKTSLPKYALQICDSAIKKFPESHGAQLCKQLKQVILTKNVTVQSEQLFMPAKPLEIFVQYKNINKLYFNIIPLDENTYKTWNYVRRNDVDSLYKALLKNALPPGSPASKATKGSINLTGSDDLLAHSAKHELPAQKTGHYVLVTSADSNFNFNESGTSMQVFAVSNLRAVVQNRIVGPDLLFVTSAENGAPVKDAEVKLMVPEYDQRTRSRNYKEFKTEKTGKNGSINLERSPGYQGYAFEVRKENDVLLLYQGVHINDDQKIVDETQTLSSIFTDRSIYRPGQVVYFKGLIYSRNNKQAEPLKNHSTQIKFYDANYQLISQKDVTTNEFGSYSGSFSIPTGRLTGTFSLTDDLGSTSLQVEEYKRPNFEVRLDTLKSSYRLNEKITITGKAETYSGAALNNAKVNYHVVRNTYWPFWFFYWRPQPNVPDREITNGETQTKADGTFEITFTAAPDPTIKPEDKPFFSYTIYADVTDQSGETQPGQTVIKVGYQGLQANIAAPGWWSKNTDLNFSVITQNLSGQNVSTTGKLIIEKLKEPAKPEHPHRQELYEIPDYMNGKHFEQGQYMQTPVVEKQVFETEINTNTEQKIAAAKLKKLDVGRYRMRFLTKDVFGQEVVAEQFFNLYDEKSRKPNFTAYSYFIPHKIKNIEPGQKAEFIWGSSVQANAFVVVEQEGKILYEKWISVNKGQQKIELPVTEENRGGMYVNIFSVVDGYTYQYSEFIDVPWPRHDLQISTTTFRDKILPGKPESWTFTVKLPDGKAADAEVLAGMYDASLDAFLAHDWYFNYYQQRGSTIQNFSLNYRYFSAIGLGYFYQPTVHHFHQYKNINYFGYWFGGVVLQKLVRNMTDSNADLKAPAFEPKKIVADENAQTGAEDKEKEQPQLRRNKQETAFFYPQMRTNEKGEVTLTFTSPDALTRWKLMLFAHTQDMKFGQLTNFVTTQKELMVQPNLPRFLREGDEITFNTKISNLSGKALNGRVYLKLMDAVNSTPLKEEIFVAGQLTDQNFSIEKNGSTVVSWKLKIPAGVEAIKYQVFGTAGNFNDGEEGIIPVLPRRILVTETKPFYLRGSQSKTLNISSLLNPTKTKTPYKLVVENTSNPAWYAVQALPYLSAKTNENTDAVFKRFYANALANHIVKSQPEIKNVFDAWLRNTSGTNPLQSNLQKNQELKSVILEETPWMQDAANEAERKRNIALLFDENNLGNGLEEAITKLEQMQLPDGSWPWFSGMQGDRFITQSIVTGFGRLEKMKVRTEYLERIRPMLTKAILYLDEKMTEDHNRLIALKDFDKNKNYLNPTIIQYLYARSMFPMYQMIKPYQKAYSFWLVQAVKKWHGQPLQQKAMLAVTLFNLDEKKPAHDILHSVDEYALHSDEMGKYWKELNNKSFSWYNQPIETQALLIEAYDLVEHDDEAVEEMKIWLLQQKQTQMWPNERSTADAVYALLLKGSEMLKPQPPVKVFLGDAIYGNENKSEAGTAYNAIVLNGTEIKAGMGKITVSSTAQGLVWGSIYYQYFDDIDAVKPSASPLSISKQVFVQKFTPNGPELIAYKSGTQLNTGDIVKIQVKIKCDRAMEYVHLKDLCAAALEPVETISTYKYQGGFGYYQSVKDASMNYFISSLPKGEYMLEYALRVNQSGYFSNGISTIQCLYAPGFSSHSGGSKIEVK